MKTRIILGEVTKNIILFIGDEDHERMIVIEPNNVLYHQFLNLIQNEN